ncbi:hypothetical protein Droror1_Dr00014183 [Drosera rotundifolia]
MVMVAAQIQQLLINPSRRYSYRVYLGRRIPAPPDTFILNFTLRYSEQCYHYADDEGNSIMKKPFGCLTAIYEDDSLVLWAQFAIPVCHADLTGFVDVISTILGQLVAWDVDFISQEGILDEFLDRFISLRDLGDRIHGRRSDVQARFFEIEIFCVVGVWSDWDGSGLPVAPSWLGRLVEWRLNNDGEGRTICME